MAFVVAFSLSYKAKVELERRLKGSTEEVQVINV